MKNMALICIVCVLFSGCDYTVPLTESPVLEIDAEVIGLWKRSGDAGKTEHLLVLPLSKYEYLVSFPSGSQEAMYARACIHNISGQTLVQLKWIGTGQATLPENNRIFQYAAYAINGDSIAIRLLNSSSVKSDVNSSEELAAAIIENINEPHVFRDEMVFIKVKKQ